MSTGLQVDVHDLTHRFGRTSALDGVDVTFRPDVITGLLGRNGAGKSTLCRAVGGLLRPSHGRVEIGGEPVWENPDRTARVAVMRDRGVIVDDLSIAANVDLHARLRPHWDGVFFASLLEAFEVPARRTPATLSTGRRAALRAAFALASRAEVTVFDEVHLGMDAVARRAFYDALLADYAAHPRTVILSSHLLEEIQPLVEDVVVLDRGRVVAAGEVDELRRAHSRGDSLASLTDVLVDLTAHDALAGPVDPTSGAAR